jgi:diguanylate cyclase (GGDEF)-like protein
MDLISNCLPGPHDARVLAGAAIICFVACLTSVVLASLARYTGFPRFASGLAVTVAGMGAWSAHFMALLAYNSPYPLGFDLSVTLFSALIALVFAAIAFTVRFRSRRMVWQGVGGAVFGLGIVIMHYVGTAALRLPGELVYDPALIGASAMLGTGVGALAFIVLGWSRRMSRIIAASVLLSLAIIGLHITGIASALLMPDGSPVRTDVAASRLWLAALMASVMVALLVSAITMLVVGLRLKKQVMAETSRLRSLSDAAFEAIAICDARGRIVDVNTMLSQLLATAPEALVGTPVKLLFRDTSQDLMEKGGRMVTALAAGTPVEVLTRPVSTTVGPRLVIAVRDLRGRLEVERRMLHLARHDPLTGLPNRALLNERLTLELAQARAGGPGFALMCLDLDRFKAVNDTHGHAAGDAVLREAARRLRAATRHDDFIARLGGDEFVIIRLNDGAADSIALMAARICEHLSEPFDLGNGARGDISASIGIARCPQDTADAEELQRCADVALYSVKRDGRNGTAFYSRSMDEVARQRSALENDLRLATPRGELELYWQPQRRVVDDTLIGFEALLRWQRPGQGDMPPEEFVPKAESSGAILPIGAWVLRTACTEAAKWQRPLRVSINISVVQLQQKDFVEMVQIVLRDAGLAPERLELEIKEGVLLAEQDDAIMALKAVQALGVRVALDDFGSGHAALGMLRTFSFDRLHIGRAVVKDMSRDAGSLAMMRAIMGLGRELKMPVLAEGVESADQLKALRQEGCEVYQGYLGGRPEPVAAYQRLLRPAHTLA